MSSFISNKNIILLSLILIGFHQGYSQLQSINESSSKLVTDLGIEARHSIPEVMTRTIIADENSIFIQQIGTNNTASATIYSKNRDVNLVQTGYANQSKIHLAGETVTHNLIQNGNNNLFLEYGNSPNLNLERNIIQDGTDQGVVIFGSNTLTDKLILNQQGSSKTITIRNFN